MRLTLKLALVLFLGVFAVLAGHAYYRVQREARLFESDMSRDQAVVARILREAMLSVWEEDGEDAALRVLALADARDPSLQVRWVWLDSRSGPEQGPVAPPEVLSPLSTGNPVIWTEKREEGPGWLYTYLPARAPDGGLAAVEVSESLEHEQRYLRTSLVRVLVTSALTALVTGLVALLSGAWLVGRPTQRIVEKARRIGGGDFSGELEIEQRDELGEIAREMNAMSDRLADAQRRLQSEVDARLRALEQLRHADRLITVGKLAAGVAHELGTPLNVVSARAKMIASGEVQGDEVPENARIVDQQVERMSRIIRQLLQFARPPTPRPTQVDLRAVAEHTAELLAPIARKHRAEVSVAPVREPVVAFADRDQLQQVLMNLMVNGIQSMPEGGVLLVEVEAVRAKPPAPDASEEDYACVRVTDRGSGISPEDLPHVFDPFFTTKDVSVGTGLGLSVSYGIVREHGGWIEVKSEPGEGSCFSVFLPED